ncbi:hypothetical protein BDM02DRAFT_3181952 [Thelephora ganbajun]|uniref:Uncharacterized protein n=1 Tax=Thelephora ganbajun TaxID=370292 RepID=A0ACB6ZX14_THEGA|nr:hypothetical protein BDM02DRAFT_3181952 [Thelephora ganbajun]
MSSFLKINFYDQHFIDFKRLDPMRPMDLGDGPELLELSVTLPRDAPETTWNPFFGTRSLYTGYLYDGSNSRPVFVKWAKSKQRMEELKREGDFYCSALRKLQGVVVPNFYGYYAATGHGLRGLGCMILEQMDRGDVSNGEVDNRSKLEAAYRLHKVGVRHCGLNDKENFVTHGEKVYIIGFSEAKAGAAVRQRGD